GEDVVTPPSPGPSPPHLSEGWRAGGETEGKDGAGVRAGAGAGAEAGKGDVGSAAAGGAGSAAAATGDEDNDNSKDTGRPPSLSLSPSSVAAGGGPTAFAGFRFGLGGNSFPAANVPPYAFRFGAG
ncbi:unnamed protein product, partial [Discosporangium mesarthrocarpum]